MNITHNTIQELSNTEIKLVTGGCGGLCLAGAGILVGMAIGYFFK